MMAQFNCRSLSTICQIFIVVKRLPNSRIVSWYWLKICIKIRKRTFISEWGNSIDTRTSCNQGPIIVLSGSDCTPKLSLSVCTGLTEVKVFSQRAKLVTNLLGLPLRLSTIGWLYKPDDVQLCFSFLLILNIVVIELTRRYSNPFHHIACTAYEILRYSLSYLLDIRKILFSSRIRKGMRSSQ